MFFFEKGVVRKYICVFMVVFVVVYIDVLSVSIRFSVESMLSMLSMILVCFAVYMNIFENMLLYFRTFRTILYKSRKVSKHNVSNQI